MTASAPEPEQRVVAAIARRGIELLMVLQAGPGETPYWSLPAGRLEPGESGADGLVRELREETGLEVVDPGELAFVCRVDDRLDSFAATIWTWELAVWHGELEPNDPDGLVLDAAWVARADAVRHHLERVPWHGLTVAYLRGRVPRGSRWSRLVHADGRDELRGDRPAAQER